MSFNAIKIPFIFCILCGKIFDNVLLILYMVCAQMLKYYTLLLSVIVSKLTKRSQLESEIMRFQAVYELYSFIF
jgi:hypothetical protein